MKFKRFLSFVLVFAMLMSLGVTALADGIITDAYLSGEKALRFNTDDTVNIANGAAIEGHLINDDNTVSTVTTDDVEDVLIERGWAVLRGDGNKVKELEDELDDMGVKDSTPAEIALFAGDTVQPMAASSSSVTYKTSTSTVTVNGSTYQVKETIALPTTDSNLFHSASVNNKTTSSSVAAGEYELFKVIGNVAYAQYGRFVSAYDTLKSVISGFSKTTDVYGITASYVCGALEQVRFYAYKNNGVWTNYGSSSYVQTAFSGTIFSTNYNGGSKQGLNVAVSSKEDIVYSQYSYGAANILSRYLNTYAFNKSAQVVNVFFYHNADGTRKNIKSFGMLCPTTTSDIH